MNLWWQRDIGHAAKDHDSSSNNASLCLRGFCFGHRRNSFLHVHTGWRFWDWRMKRFTETTKWRDPWYRRLSPTAKLLWLYMTDNCDSTGLIDLDLEAASFDIGGTVNEKHLDEIKSRTQAVGGSKIFITKFIPFQYGSLSESCPAHKPVLKLVSQRGISLSEIGYQYPNATLTLGYLYPTGKERKGKEPEKEEGVKGEIYSPESRVALFHLNEKSGRKFRETSENLGFISERLKESGVDLDGVRMMIDRQCRLWIGTPQAEYLRPQTLFNKTKFDAYYAAKDQPISTAISGQNNQKPIAPVRGSTPVNGF